MADSVSMDKKKKDSSMRNSLYMIGFILKNEPMAIIGNMLASVACQVPMYLSNVLLLRYIINGYSDGRSFAETVTVTLIFTAVLFIGYAINSYYMSVVQPANIEKLNCKLYSSIYDKAAKMDLAAYDDPKFYNDFVMAMQTLGNSVERYLFLINNFSVMMISIVAISGAIAAVDPVCLIMIAACAVIMIPLGKYCSTLEEHRVDAMLPFDRRSLYYQRVFYLSDYAKELRLNPAGKMISDRYDDMIIGRLKTIKVFLLKAWGLYFVQDRLLKSVIIYLGVTLYIGYRAIVLKDISLGDFTAAFNGASSVSEIVVLLTSWILFAMRKEGVYVGKYKKFMSAPETIKSGDVTTVFDSPKTIKLENVSFTYPGNNKPTLKNINMEINPYEKIALVGYNGAGKTTLTNLLLRLYDVSDGKITVDGEDIRNWNIDAWHDNIAAVFQDYSLFGATMGENVAMNSDFDSERVMNALKQSGFEKELKNGTDTVLLREFDEDGTSFSGGEAQKIAVSRAFYKKCAFAVLDEPSANLDPEAEYTLNDAMARAADDKTVIFISHRLSTTVMADRIYMLENGEIVESGSHEELMALGGKYAYMFRLQAEKYNKNTDV